MKVLRVVTERLCDACGSKLTLREVASSEQKSYLRPLDFCNRCFGIGLCAACNQLSWEVVSGNCLPCWGLALAKPRGRCQKSSSWFLCGADNEGHRRHECTLLNHHTEDVHQCHCGAPWVGGRGGFRRSLELR